MRIIRWLYAKSKYELQTVWALANYPFRRSMILSRLERTMPNLSIEPTNICNANCVFCAYQFQKRAQGIMSLSLYEKILAQFAEVGGGDINLTPTVGEPLADRHIIKRIELARSNPMIKGIGMYSNMISLARIGEKQLVYSGLTSLTVSTSGLDKGMYERVYRSKRYTKMLRNLIAFARANLAAGSPVDLFVDMRVDRPAKEIFSFDDYKELADLIGPERIGLKLRYDNWAGKIEQNQLSGNMKLRSRVNLLRPRIAPCSELYSGPMVYWDGRVGACGCRDVDAIELIIGDANTAHIADIWLGENLQTLRDEFMTFRIKGICKSCTHYNPIAMLLRPDRKQYYQKLHSIKR